MYGTSATVAAKAESRVEHSAGADALHALASRLNREFSAPVGLLDPAGGSWQVRLGSAIDAFPDDGPALLATLTTLGLAPGHAVVWHPDSAPREIVWLGLWLPWETGERGHLVALVGFAASAAAPEASDWGPTCPEPALRAWGQSVAGQVRAEASPQSGAGDSAPRVEGNERLLIARLIRRLRISDAPERFQALATGAVRGALSVAAVAWVPGHLHEPVTISGAIEGLRGQDYRTLIPRPGQGPVQIVNRATGAPGTRLKGHVAVAADSQASAGWLIAVNPLDDRLLSAREVEVLQPVASLIATQQTNARLYADLKELLFGVIRALTAAIDAKDPYTSGHSERVARIAVRLAQELDIPANRQSDLYLMGLLHDIGKIGVDDAVLKKSGPLTPEEYRAIQAHVEIGVHILADLKKLSHLLPGVRHHHECVDGSGYPSGLAGEEIPLEARILAVADSFDAMSSTRPYRRRLTPMQIDKVFHAGAGAQWDPKIVAALFACRLDVEHIRQKGLGESLQIVVNETLGRS
jgi:HD-GYP domain-containing protein (c-di-GMP phosphodiesterase class II)